MPAPADMVLEIDASPFLVEGRLTEQRVGVSANGHPLGEWVWTEKGSAHRALTIPKAFLNAREQRLDFQVARPGSPEAYGVSGDPRQLGLLLTRLRLYEAGK